MSESEISPLRNLTGPQLEMWFAQKLDPNNPLYDSGGYADIKGSIEISLFEEALRRFVADAQILHLRFVEGAQGPMQRVDNPPAMDFRYIDVSGEHDPFAAAYAAMQADASNVFDIISGPLMLQRLYRLGAHRYVWYQRYHHIVMDGVSVTLAARRVGQIYGALLAGHAVSPSDFAPIDSLLLGDERYHASPRYASDQAYWRDYAATLPPCATMDGAPPDSAGAFVRCSASLPDTLSAALLAAEQTIGKWPQVLTAIIAAYLFRYTDGRVNVFDFPVAARTKETRDTPGTFANVLPLHLPMRDQDNVVDLSERVGAEIFKHLKHQLYRVKDIKQLPGAPRGPMFGPRINIIAFDNSFRFGGSEATLHSLSNGIVNDFAVTVVGQPGTASFELHVDGNARLHDAPTLSAHARRIVRFIEEALADPCRPIGRMKLLDTTERERLLTEFNATEAAYPAHLCTHEQFEQQVERTPDAVALEYGDQRVTYAELNARANRLAHYLLDLGVRPDTRVALCASRSVDLIVGLLGVLKAGGAYVPIDPGYPPARIAHILNDAAPLAVLVDRAHRRTVAELLENSARVIELDAAEPPWRRASIANPSPKPTGLTSNHLAYVIYTSGSTGTPKGVMVEHRQLGNLIAWHVRRFELQPGSRTTSTAGIAFDAAAWEIWPALCCGATLLLPPPDIAGDTTAMLEWWRRQRIDCAFLVTPLALLAIEAGLPSSLRRLLIGGDRFTAVPAPLPASVQLINNYGPTEATVVATCGLIVPEETVHTIGRPIDNARVYLLDANGEPAPPGAIGEIYIGGAGVARGYLNRPEDNAQRFRPDPFATAAGKPHARMYRTGDLGRYLPDGRIVFLGRNDQQLKIRGFRIELGEIEAQLLSHASVREAAVAALRDARGETRLVAYVVARPNGTPASGLAGVLRAHLQTRLPEYMLPAAFVPLEALPLTPNGKLDRSALPTPSEDAFMHHGDDMPESETERLIAAIWSDLLNVDRIGRHDNFFTLGGHSLLAIQAIERLRRHGLPIAGRALFQHPTPAELAASLQDARTHEPGVVVPPNRLGPGTRAITPDALPLADLSQPDIDRIVERAPGGIDNIQDIYALAPLQDGILFHHLMSEAADPYLLSAQMHFADRAALDRYLTAMQRVVDRHDVLRTAFAWDGLSEAVQIVYRKAQLPVETLSLDPNEGPVDEQLRQRFNADRYRMDLTCAPLLRFAVAPDGAPGGGWRALVLLHHMVGDHSTLELMHAEVQAVLDGREAQLPEPTPYRELVAQARLRMPPQTHEAFFREMLADIDAPTLPYGLASVRYDGTQTIEATRALPAELCERLREQARRLGVSVAALCHLGWAAVLANVSGERKVVFGTVLFGRMAAGSNVERAMGLYINTLPLRIDIGADSVECAARTAQQRLTQLLAHEHASLALAQRCSPAGAGTPLFNAILNYRHNLSTSHRVASSISGVQWLGGRERTNYPLAMSIDDDGHRLRLNAQAVAPASPAQLCDYLEHALERIGAALADASGDPVDRLLTLPASERYRVVDAWNATERPFPSALCMHHLFERQADETPHATAVVFGARRLTYAQLNARANRLAHRLIERGVRPDSLVAVCAERGIAMVVALLGILKAGGAYVPLDPSYPSERLAYILGDADPLLLLVDAASRAATSALSNSPPVIDLGEFETGEHEAPLGNPFSENLGLTSLHLAYVIYTSGSTGMPKGVQNEHRALVNRLVWMQRAYGLKADDVVLQKTPFSFDVSVWEFFWTLSSGATLCVAPPGVHRDADRLASLIAEQGVTTAHFVPSMLSGFLDAKGADRCTSLRRVVCSGEALPAATVRRFKQLLPGADLHNLYGPTEAAIDVTAWTCPASFEDEIVPIGKPISNTRIYLLDPQYRPVPIGAVGELYIGGVGVARGYLNRPELTEERFLPDPFALAAGKPYPRMYRTGDLARYLPDGNIVFLGRNDHQVKIRGLRIELGEIEAQLAQHEAVREAVVVAREAADGETHLVAYIIASEQKAVAKNSLDENAVACEQEHLRQHEAMQRHALAHQLRAHLQAKLPDYMVPAAFVQLDALPVTANGKLDRKALPAPSDEAFARHDYEAPQGEIEQILAALWCELLNLDHIGRHDDFFELGGHSLLAVRLLSRLPAALAVEVPLSTLFAHPTLRAFAAAIGTARSGTHVRALPPITPTPRARTVPLSFAQQRLWFLAALEGESTTYHVPVILRLRGSLDAAAWRHAMDTVWRRHEALRTVFPVEQGQPTARLLPAENGVPWRQFDLSSSADALTELRRLCESEARALFDLATGPLIRASLMRIAEGEHVFMVVQHHIVSDGWSIRVLLSELLAHYQASINADIAPLPDLSIQYPDYVAWQRRWLNAERLADEARYWRQTLSGAPALLTLPTDRPRPPRQQFAAAHVPVTLDADLANALRRTCRQHGVTLFMLMVAAWAVVLARLSGQSEVVIGAPTANRPRAELEPLIGLFVNTLALRIDLAGQPDLAALLTRVRRTVLGAQEHQNLPFEQVVELAQPWRQLDHTPIFQVMIAWQEVDIRPLQSRTLRIEPIGGTFDQVKFDLELDLADDGRTINGALRYATALFDEPTARRHSGYLATMLRAIAEGAAPAPTQVALVGADEREILLGAFNRTDRRYQADCCVHEQIERQAQSAPDAIAIECDDQRITYAQLNARANRLAHHLITLGVRPDARVAVCASRSPDLVAGLLAVLKAGGAYVPVDPIAPGARIAQVLADAAPVAVLVDSSTRETLANRLPVHLPVLELDAPRAAWRNASDTNLRPHRLGLTPRHLAYVIYTSGSTGTPKGVMVEHRQLVNLIAWHINRFELRSGSRTTCTAGLAFDAAAWEIWPALASGATLLLPPSSVHNDTAALLHWWRAQRIDCAFLVTPLAMLAIEAGLPPGLRRLLIGGDRFSGLPAPLPASVQLFNNYGPTEATVVASSGLIDRDESTPTIGRPIDNARIYLLDENGEPAPLGAPGEIYIGGAGVARGYLNRAELDAQRFLPDPFARAAGDADARMYRTGDLARYLPDGRIVFLGRNDQQIKIRGYRIELGEIEAQLRTHAAVGDVAVIAQDDEQGAPRLIAYLVAQADAPERSALTTALRAHLQARLPDYMTPAAFIWLDALPLTSNGKLDRHALPAPGPAAFDRGAYEAPIGAVETMLAEVWERLLGADRIGRHDNFFMLGGHSLLAAQMISEVRATLGRDLSIRTLFEAPTIAQLSERIDRGASSDALSVLLPLREQGHGAPLFCVHPAGGFSWPYAGLLRYLPERPLFALQARSLRGERAAATIEAMASDYLAQIRTVQPEGPYHLLGWSLGCHIAHAIATQLQDSGEHVEQLIMLDGYPIASDAPFAPPSEQDIMQVLVGALSDAPLPPPDHALTLSTVKARLVESSNGVLSALGDGVVEAIFDEFKVAPRLAARFKPRTYRGDILFFRARHADTELSPRAWQPYVDGRIESHDIDCAHEAMMRPHALAQLGPRLAAALQRETAS